MVIASLFLLFFFSQSQILSGKVKAHSFFYRREYQLIVNIQKLANPYCYLRIRGSFNHSKNKGSFSMTSILISTRHLKACSPTKLSIIHCEECRDTTSRHSQRHPRQLMLKSFIQYLLFSVYILIAIC